MLHHLIRPFRFVAKALLAQDTPRQLALGLAMGMVLGLVPKGNLTAVVLGLIVFGSRVNLGMASVSALVFSLLAMGFEPLTGMIGEKLLMGDALQGTWTYLYNLPVVPWTAFNNTVVLGSLVLGLCLFYPVYRVSLFAFEKYQPWIKAKLERYRVTKLLLGAETLAKLEG